MGRTDRQVVVVAHTVVVTQEFKALSGRRALRALSLGHRNAPAAGDAVGPHVIGECLGYTLIKDVKESFGKPTTVPDAQLGPACTQPLGTPAGVVIALSKAQHGVAERRDANERTAFGRAVTDEVIHVSPGCALVRDRPEVACVPPDVLEQESGTGIPSSVLNQFKFGADASRSLSPEPGGEFGAVGEESVNAAALKSADEAYDARLRELGVAGKRK